MQNSDIKTAELLVAALEDDGNIFYKKMFGCYCIYYDSEPVGWVSNGVFWMKNVKREELYINDYLQEKKSLHQIPISVEQFNLPWLKETVVKTSEAVKQKES